MTQIVLNVEDRSLLPGLRKILNNLKGVSVVQTTTTRKAATRKGTLSRAIEEVKNGQVTRVGSIAELMYELEA